MNVRKFKIHSESTPFELSARIKMMYIILANILHETGKTKRVNCSPSMQLRSRYCARNSMGSSGCSLHTSSQTLSSRATAPNWLTGWLAMFSMFSSSKAVEKYAKKQPTKKLHLSEPCSQSWNHMSPGSPFNQQKLFDCNNSLSCISNHARQHMRYCRSG